MQLTKTNLILIFICIIALTICATAIAYYNYQEQRILGVDELNMTITASSGLDIGFNVNNTGLFFGKVPIGVGSSDRQIDIVNKLGQDILINAIAIGDMADMISIDKNNFVLHENESTRLTVTASLPEKTQPGNYTGKLIVKFLKP